MSRINLLNYNFNSLLILLLSYLLIFTEVDLVSNVFFFLLLLFSIFQKNFKYRYKKIPSSILAIISIYILFVLNDQTLSKEYFINLILALIFLKYSEIENKEHHYFFSYSCVFLAISSLVYGQDLISSFLSLAIVILSIIHLYSLNQIKILKLNIKNLAKYFIFALSIFPIIAVVYFIFPRAELNIKLFETKKNQLGIPEKISLGSFQDISDSDENVFIFTDANKNINQKYYFRVKIFDNLSSSKDWLNTDYKILLSLFKDNFKIKQNNEEKEVAANLLMFPHEKNWIPKLSGYSFENQDLNFNYINDTIKLNKILNNKKSFKLTSEKRKILYENKIINYYTLLPKNISPKLKSWANEKYFNSTNDKDYLDKILNEFKENDFYYSLTPASLGNNYEKFFFETKTGYCEYYAGTFAILARIVGIPSRIVTGYYGGSYNDLGDFYTFKQQDAHSWVEVFIEGKWIHYDPTLSVPIKNILNSNNANFDSTTSTSQTSTNTNEIKINKFGLYFDYINYLWTNSFLQYDEKSRQNFIKEKLSKIDIYKQILLIVLFIMIMFYLFKIAKFIYSKDILYKLFFNTLKNRNKISLNLMTHQEIYKNLNKDDKLRFGQLFDLYEKFKFSKGFKVSYKYFFKTNLQILKYAIFSK